MMDQLNAERDPASMPTMDNMVQDFQMDFCVKYPTNIACGGVPNEIMPIPQDFSRVKFILQIK
jgi:hypothetical protein